MKTPKTVRLERLTKREKRIIAIFLKCKVGEEGKSRRKITIGDCWDCFALGKTLVNGQTKNA